MKLFFFRQRFFLLVVEHLKVWTDVLCQLSLAPNSPLGPSYSADKGSKLGTIIIPPFQLCCFSEVRFLGQKNKKFLPNQTNQTKFALRDSLSPPPSNLIVDTPGPRRGSFSRRNRLARVAQLAFSSAKKRPTKEIITGNLLTPSSTRGYCLVQETVLCPLYPPTCPQKAFFPELAICALAPDTAQFSHFGPYTGSRNRTFQNISKWRGLESMRIQN